MIFKVWLLSITVLLGGLFVAYVTYADCQKQGYSKLLPFKSGYSGYISCEVVK